MSYMLLKFISKHFIFIIVILNGTLSSILSSNIIAQGVKSFPAMQETLVWFLGWEDPLEKGKATHSSILAWDTGTWQATVHGVPKSQTQWSNFSNKRKLLNLRHTKKLFDVDPKFKKGKLLISAHRNVLFLDVFLWKRRSTMYQESWPFLLNRGLTYEFIYPLFLRKWGFPGGSMVKNPPGKAGDVSLISVSGRSLAGGHGNPVQYSCLENSMNRGVWWLLSMGSQRAGHDWACILSICDLEERTYACQMKKKEGSWVPDILGQL